jgi:hypothetical protein
VNLYLEDLHVGQRFESRPHPLDVEQIKRFAADFDPQPFHLDEEAAKASLFGGLAASGWHTAALTMRLLVESVPLADGLVGAELELVSDESVYEYEQAHLPVEAWPPTPWFPEWSTGLDLFDLPAEASPVDLRWLVYRRR